MDDRFVRLVNIIAKLRDEKDGCPWDKEQTLQSLKPFLIEEAYEVIEAIDKEDTEGLKEELGDVLMQVVMQAQLAKEQGMFDIQDVLFCVCEKLIRRHPHVFGDNEASLLKFENSAQVIEQWKAIKKREKERVMVGP
ncbi:MAG: MazG family protein [Nitrospirota bacterium]